MVSISQGIVDSAGHLLENHKDGLLKIYRFKRDLDKGKYILNQGRPDQIDAKDLLWQGRDDFDQIGSAYVAFWLWIGIVTHPHTLSASIKVGVVPSGNRAIEANNRALSQLPNPFSAAFEGGNYGPDGYLSTKGVDDLPETVPLEVGSAHPAVLYLRAVRSRCFARWPYESKFIYVFKPPPMGRGLGTLMSSHLENCKECLERNK